ncbi:MAG: DUF3857 domain-containing protein [Novosphingobium sp.]
MKKHLPAILALLAASVPSGAVADDTTVASAPAPAWAVPSELVPVPPSPTGPFFFRRYNSTVHLDSKGQSTFIAQYVKINNPNGLQAGNISLSWNPAAGKPIVHALKIHRDGTEIDIISNRKFEILRREDQLEQSVLNGILTAVLQVPDLRVGDELEFSATIPSQDPTLGSDSSGLLAMAGALHQGRYRVRLSWDNGQEPYIRTTDDLAEFVKREPNAIEVDADDPKPANPPKDAPPRYQWSRILEYSDFKQWQDFSKRISPLFESAAKLSANSQLKSEAQRLANANAGAMARAAAALKLVQQDVRYIYVGLNGGNLTPTNADVTWSRRYGDCKAKTVLLLALLNELGILAEPVLVNLSGTDDGLETRLPNAAMFDHVMVRAHIDGGDWWLDGTLPSVVGPLKQLIGNHKWVLPVTAQGAPLQSIVYKPLEQPGELSLYEIDARDGFDEPARIKHTSINRGYAGIAQYQLFSAISSSQLTELMKKELEGNSTWNSIESVNWHYDSKTLASVMEVSGTGPVDWENDRNGSRSLFLPGGGFNPPERRQRGAGQDGDAPFYRAPEFECNVTTVRIPKTTSPRNWTNNTSYGVRMFGGFFRRKFQQRGDAISMIRSYRTETPEIDAPTAAADNQRISKFDNSKAWIFYEPWQKEQPVSSADVPATFEKDWVADATPCF